MKTAHDLFLHMTSNGGCNVYIVHPVLGQLPLDFNDVYPIMHSLVSDTLIRAHIDEEGDITLFDLL